LRTFILRLVVVCLSFSLMGCLDSLFNDGSEKPTKAPTVTTTSLPDLGSSNFSSGTISHVVLLLPLQGSLGRSGQAVRDGFLTAYNDAPAGAKPAHVEVIDTSTTNIQQAYQQAVSQGADFIVGPLAKSEVQSLNSMGSLSVPVLALNNLDPSQSINQHLYQFGLSPLDEASQAATMAWQQNYRSALIIVPAGSWGQNIAREFQEQWQSQGGNVADSLYYSGSTQTLTLRLRNLLHFKQGADKQSLPTRRHDFDVIFLAATPDAARQIRPLLKFYYAGNMPIYATALVYTGTPQPGMDRDLDDIVFCDAPWVLTNGPNGQLRQQISVFWPGEFRQNLRLYALGVDAYSVMTRLNSLQSSSTFAGATGTLSLNDQQRIVRQLTCARFEGGVPQVVN